MKIIYLTQHFPPESQAAAFRAAETADKLTEIDFEVHVVTGFPNLPAVRKKEPYKNRLFITEKINRVKVTRVYTPLDTKNSSLARLLNYTSFMILSTLRGLFMQKPDIVFASSPPLLASLSGLVLAKLKRAKFVLEVRDLWVDFAILLGQLKGNFFINLARRIEKLVIRASDKIVVVTTGYKEHFEKLGIKAEKIEVVHGGVDFINVSHQVLDGKTIRKEYDLKDRFIVGYAGNVGLAQGLEVVIDAAEYLKDNSEIIFMIVGEGADRERLARLAKEKELKNIFFVEQQPKEEVLKYIGAFNCSLITLLNELLFQITLPSKLFENMAYGKPVLLGLGGEAKQILEDAEAGLYFDLDRPDTLVEAILKLKANPDLCKRMSKNGYNYTRANFDRRMLVEKLGKIFDEVAGSKGENYIK